MQFEGQAAVDITQLRGAKARSVAGRIGPEIEGAALHLGGQRDTAGVVDVDYRSTQAGPGKQLAFGRPVGVHAAVVVEVVTREVGKQGHGDTQAGQALLDDADRRSLDCAGLEAGVGKLAQRRMQHHRVGGGQAGEFDLRGARGLRHAAGHTRRHRRHADAQGTDHGTAAAEQGQRLRRPPGRRGLAIGAGAGDDIERLTGLLEEGVGDRAGGGFQPRQGGDACIVEGIGVQAVALDQAGRGAGLQRAGDEAAAVGGGARPGDEAIAGAHLAAVGGDGAGDPGAQPAGGGVGGLEGVDGHAQKLSCTALVVICGLTSRSGATPSMRRVCCTTWLNTGAATSPP